MADAQKSTRTETVEVEKEVVVLTLTPKEASTLLRVTGRIGGFPEGPRGQMDSIARALRDAGVVQSSPSVTGYVNLA